MKTNSTLAVTKLTRLILAASIGSLIWTGCSSTQTGSFSASQVDKASVMAAPVDQSQFHARPDTHPELRTGLWSFQKASLPRVVEAPTIENENPEAVDSTQLIAYEPAVINVAALGGAEPAPGTVITEAAGAETSAQEIEEYSRDLERRAALMKEQ